MGIVLAFVAGYAIGARAGQQGFDELVESVRAVRDSEEFRGFVSALRSHASATLEDLSIKAAEGDDARLSVQDMLDRVRGWMAPDPTSHAS